MRARGDADRRDRVASSQPAITRFVDDLAVDRLIVEQPDQLRRAERPRRVVDGFGLGELRRGRHALVLQPPRRDQHAALQRADRAVVGLHRPRQAAADGVEVLRELRDPVVELAAQIADLLRVPRDLFPAASRTTIARSSAISVSGLASITPRPMLNSSSAGSSCSADVSSDSPGTNITTMSGAGWKCAQ